MNYRLIDKTESMKNTRYFDNLIQNVLLEFLRGAYNLIIRFRTNGRNRMKGPCLRLPQYSEIERIDTFITLLILQPMTSHGRIFYSDRLGALIFE